MKTYCKKYSRLLKAQKTTLLDLDPLAYFPCETSDFSAITIELGGPHRRTNHRGLPHTYDPASWGILTTFGNYDPSRGGHIILWDLGWVLTFAPGDSILIPPGLIRYSFVAIQPGETRYSMLQWAGSGIRRFFENGERDDTTFAMKATEEEHVAREQLRRETHVASIGAFPRTDGLRTGDFDFKYSGMNPLY
ncbi:hypothetical protein R3P38DRAFT_2521990 [Favolaschia claudopus]|uniref:Uncharacterized protein n=1 Tax=Favolaschia claudopus TaxID=2862362 RepID=A0AAW0C0R1_9AGAR